MIDYVEFASALRWMEGIVGKPATKEQAQGMYECLQDLEPGVLRTAVRRVLCEHEYPTLPMPALIRKAALEEMAGQKMAAHEAQAIASKAVRSAGGVYASLEERKAAYDAMPPLVADLVRKLGWGTIADCEDPEVLRGQWRRAWDETQARARTAAALPEHLRPPAPAIGRQVAIPSNLLSMPVDVTKIPR